MTMPARRDRSNVSWGAVMFAFLAVPFTSIIYGATLAKLWEWFVADTFSIKAISTAEAIGLSLVVTFVTYQHDARNPDDDEFGWAKVLELILGGIARALFVLAFGVVVKGFV